MLELKVKMININLPVGHRLLQDCMPLYEYAWFMEKIRTYWNKWKDRDAAITQAIKDCLEEGIFAEFVREHGSEVENMLFEQFDIDDAMAVRYEEGVEDGIEQGIEQGEQRLLVHQVCSKLQRGESPEKIALDLLADEKKVAEICRAYEEYGPEEDAVCCHLYQIYASMPT